MHVIVRESVGENAITREDGARIYGVIYPSLRGGNEVRLDFYGVKVFASPFLNVAIGQLLKDLAPEDLNRLLRIEHMTPAGKSTLRVVMDTAKGHYANSARAEAVDKVVIRGAFAE